MEHRQSFICRENLNKTKQTDIYGQELGTAVLAASKMGYWSSITVA